MASTMKQMFFFSVDIVMQSSLSWVFGKWNRSLFNVHKLEVIVKKVKYIPMSPDAVLGRLLCLVNLSGRSTILTHFFFGAGVVQRVSTEKSVNIGVNVWFEHDLRPGWWRSSSSASCWVHGLHSRVSRFPQIGTWKIVSTKLFTYYSNMLI